MDNKYISVQHLTRKAFDIAFQLFFVSEHDEPFNKLFERTATHYLDHPEKGLILFWAEDLPNKSIPLPTPLDHKSAADLAWTWLKNQNNSKYGNLIDFDGSHEKGYKIYNEPQHYANWSQILIVKPEWAIFGK